MRLFGQDLALIDTKIAKLWFLLDKISLNEWISLKFIRYMTMNKIHVQKRGYRSFS